MNKPTLKKMVLVLLVVVLSSAIALSLTSCLKINLVEKRVVERLQNAGAIVTYPRTAPMITEGQSDHSVGDIIYAVLKEVENESAETADDEQEEQGEAEVKEVKGVYVFFTRNRESGDWVEKQCKAYVAANKNLNPHWVVFHYDNTVVCGHYDMVRIVKTY